MFSTRDSRVVQSSVRAIALAALVATIACAEQAPVESGRIDVADAGFMTPESIVHDTIDDVYLVSNINGSPFEKDDNGFISRVNPDGTVANLKWIDGANPNLTLHAPKGMGIRGDSIFVADVNCIRIFNRVTGEAADGECIEGATFLNDVAVGPEGSIFVTDSGFQEGEGGAFDPSGTDGLYRYPFAEGRSGATLAKDPNLGHPNGVAVSSGRILVVTFGTGEILNFTAAGQRTQVTQRPDGQLDGIVFTGAGGFAFSNWTDSTVYHVSPAGQVTRIVEHVASPADIGYDTRRNRVLVPLFSANALVFQDLDPGGGGG
jgi:sugar lactone lactonase YvrE